MTQELNEKEILDQYVITVNLQLFLLFSLQQLKLVEEAQI